MEGRDLISVAMHGVLGKASRKKVVESTEISIPTIPGSSHSQDLRQINSGKEKKRSARVDTSF